MLGFPILHLKGPRIMMFQLSGFYYRQDSLREQGRAWHPEVADGLDPSPGTVFGLGLGFAFALGFVTPSGPGLLWARLFLFEHPHS